VRFLFSEDYFIGAWGLYVYYMYLPLLFIIFWRSESIHQLKPYMWTLMLTTIISAIGGIAEFCLGFVTGLQPRPIWWIYGTRIRRVTFTFDAPMTLGTFLAVGLCLFTTFWLTYPATKKQRLFFLSGALISLIGLILTFSRGPMVQAIGSLSYIGLVYFLSIRNRKKQVKLLGKGLLLCICTIILVGPVLAVSLADVLFPYLRSFFEWSKAMNPGVAIGNAVRIQMWMKSIDAFLSYPFTGIGLGMTGYTTLRFLPDSWITESFALKILVEAGLFALLAFFWLYLRIVWTGTRMALSRGRSVQRALAFGSSAGLVGIFIEGLILQILETKQVSLEFWFFIAVLIWLESRWPQLSTCRQAGLRENMV
jgi:O-antigen ligase